MNSFVGVLYQELLLVDTPEYYFPPAAICLLLPLFDFLRAFLLVICGAGYTPLRRPVKPRGGPLAELFVRVYEI